MKKEEINKIEINKKTSASSYCVSATNRGITLIALVITIIVLLILAGVTISLTLGDEGIFKVAEKSVDETKKAQIKEKIQMEVVGSYDNNGKIDIDELLKNIEKNMLGAQISGSDFPITVTVDESSFTVDEKGNVENKNPLLFSKEDIKNNPSKFYGATVTGYHCQKENACGWKIFYADENNIYIIADDYIHYDYVPVGKGETLLTKTTDYTFNFKDVMNDYAGSEDIVDEKIQTLNNDYFTKGYSTKNPNMKAVAYMLDTNAWSGFKGNSAEFAVGSPSLEILYKSYKDKYGGSNVSFNVNGNGYEFKSLSFSGDPLYTISSTSSASSYWIASPAWRANSSAGTECLLIVQSSGTLNNYAASRNSAGFRPLVCLRTGVQLELKADGTYEIK